VKSLKTAGIFDSRFTPGSQGTETFSSLIISYQ
jgi:hypothetical protein